MKNNHCNTQDTGNTLKSKRNSIWGVGEGTELHRRRKRAFNSEYQGDTGVVDAQA
jgi:hypothetical protein